MKIAHTGTATRGDMDPLLQRVAEALIARGIKTAGVVQVNTACEGPKPCDMDVRVLPDGPVFRISQSLGAGSRGCRLDPAALESAVGLVQARVEEGPDLLIVNKFGKQEASGQGFRPVIAEAALRGIPVLVGLNALNRDAFDAFTGGGADALEPSEAVLIAWIEDALAARQSAA